MEMHFQKQQVADHITVRDEIELYNCQDYGMNGNYTVACVEQNGDVTLVGRGAKEGVVTVISLAPAAPDEG